MPCAVPPGDAGLGLAVPVPVPLLFTGGVPGVEDTDACELPPPEALEEYFRHSLPYSTYATFKYASVYKDV